MARATFVVLMGRPDLVAKMKSSSPSQEALARHAESHSTTTGAPPAGIPVGD